MEKEDEFGKRLFMKNLDMTTEESVKKYFKPFGEIVNLVIHQGGLRRRRDCKFCSKFIKPLKVC